jgi:hypothetical protein
MFDFGSHKQRMLGFNKKGKISFIPTLIKEKNKTFLIYKEIQMAWDHIVIYEKGFPNI